MKTITPPQRLAATLQLPADKSISHRAAMFAALHESQSVLEGFSDAADPQSTLQCLKALNVPVEQNGDTVIIQGLGREQWPTFSEPVTLDCGNSGTTMRLLSGLLGGLGLNVCLIGDESLSARPMKRILDPLQQMGVDIQGDEQGRAPLRITPGSPFKPMRYPLPIPSAQLKSCILLAGLFGADPTEVIESVPSRDHTERMLELPVVEKNGRRYIKASSAEVIPNQSGRIPGDFSAAAFWMVAGSIHPDADIHLQQVGLNPTRTGALDILRRMDAQIQIENEVADAKEPTGDLHIQSRQLQPVEIGSQEIPNCIDELPILAVAMAFADGVSRVEGAGELRVKETDRLAAIADMLTAAEVDFDMWEDGFEIRGKSNHIFEGTVFKSYGDHRIAMAAAILAMRAQSECQITQPECIRISYPTFFDDWAKLTG
jgi:3-phosphoshikimate 1-carboxyvinyltransferase